MNPGCLGGKPMHWAILQLIYRYNYTKFEVIAFSLNVFVFSEVYDKTLYVESNSPRRGCYKSYSGVISVCVNRSAISST